MSKEETAAADDVNTDAQEPLSPEEAEKLVAKLRKTMGMMGSDNEPTRIAAMKAASEMLQRLGMSWSDFFDMANGSNGNPDQAEVEQKLEDLFQANADFAARERAWQEEMQLLKGQLHQRQNFTRTTRDASGKVIEKNTFANGKLCRTETFYPDETPQDVTHFANGMRHGPYQAWHENGQLKVEANLEKDLLEGSYRNWDDAGALRMECTYKGGEKSGVLKRYDAQERLYEEVEYKNGDMEGARKRYDAEGALLDTEYYHHNKQVSERKHLSLQDKEKMLCRIPSELRENAADVADGALMFGGTIALFSSFIIQSLPCLFGTMGGFIGCGIGAVIGIGSGQALEKSFRNRDPQNATRPGRHDKTLDRASELRRSFVRAGRYIGCSAGLALGIWGGFEGVEHDKRVDVRRQQEYELQMRQEAAAKQEERDRIYAEAEKKIKENMEREKALQAKDLPAPKQ